MDSFGEFLNYTLIGFKISDLLIIIACVFGALILDKITQWLVKKIAKRIETKHENSHFRLAVIKALPKPLHMLFLIFGCGLGLLIVQPPEWGVQLFALLRIVIQSLSLWCVIWFLMLVTDGVAAYMSEKAAKSERKLDNMIVPVLRGVTKFMLASIGILAVIQTLGYSVSSIIAGLGIGGAAVALAAKDTISNFFGSLVVFLDHPFDLGDWVSYSGVEGTVEEIRVRTTMIRSFDGSIITVPNAALTSAHIKNYHRRKIRRLDANFGLLYSTKAEQIEKIVADIKQYVQDHPEILDKGCYVGFAGFGSNSLDIFVTVYSTKIAWAGYCEVRQQFLLAVMRIVEGAGTGFAFPTRTIEFSPKTAHFPVQFDPLPPEQLEEKA